MKIKKEKELEEVIKKVLKEFKSDIVKEALKEFKVEEIEKGRKRALHNTKLLLRNYNSLKAHVEKSICSLNDIEKERLEELEEMELAWYEEEKEDEVYLSSIRRSRVRTLLMISHVEKALKELKEKTLRDNMYEHYRALEMYYIEEKSYEKIQEELTCSKNTPLRWINSMVRELSVLLFGLDGIKLDLG